jgi:hypothetical protein
MLSKSRHHRTCAGDLDYVKHRAFSHRRGDRATIPDDATQSRDDGVF